MREPTGRRRLAPAGENPLKTVLLERDDRLAQAEDGDRLRRPRDQHGTAVRLPRLPAGLLHPDRRLQHGGSGSGC